MKAYYTGRKPADWVRPAEVVSMTLCKLTGQPAPVDAAPELVIQDFAVKPDPALPVAACGPPTVGSESARGARPGGPAGLPGVLPSIPPLPGATPPPTVP